MHASFIDPQLLERMISKKTLNFYALCIIGLITSWDARAQSPAVTSMLTANIIKLVDGKTVKLSAADAKPGDVIKYTATYANNSKASVERLLASVPIPSGTTLVDNTAVPVEATASIDALTFMKMPLMRSVKVASGSFVSEPIPLEEYRALRWTVATIPAGQQVVVSIHVRVNSTLAFSAPQASMSVR